MKSRLSQLRNLARPLEPEVRLRRRWTRTINSHAQDFVEALATGPSFRSSPDEGKGIFASPFSEDPQAPEVLLKLLAEHVERPGVKLGAPGFFAFIPISSLYPAALGDYLAAVINPFAGNYCSSPGAVRLEHCSPGGWLILLVTPKPRAATLPRAEASATLAASSRPGSTGG